MPYIKPDERAKWEGVIGEVIRIVSEIPEDKKEGELNYLITSFMKRIYNPRYFDYNRAIGLLECIKQEFYRRIVAPYEDTKISENGDLP